MPMRRCARQVQREAAAEHAAATARSTAVELVEPFGSLLIAITAPSASDLRNRESIEAASYGSTDCETTDHTSSCRYAAVLKANQSAFFRLASEAVEETTEGAILDQVEPTTEAAPRGCGRSITRDHSGGGCGGVRGGFGGGRFGAVRDGERRS